MLSNQLQYRPVPTSQISYRTELLQLESAIEYGNRQIQGRRPPSVDIETISAIVQQPRSKARYQLFFLLFCIAITLVGFVPVSKTVVLQAVVVGADNEELITSGTDGWLRQLFVGDGDYVEQNQLLGLVETIPISKIELQRKRLRRLQLEEARIVAQLSCQESLVYPHWLEPESDADLSGLLSEQQQWLAEDYRKHQTRLLPLDDMVNGASERLVEVRAVIAATSKQLASTESRLQRTRALQAKGVVYDDGVYIKQLQATLRTSHGNVRKEMEQQQSMLKAAEERLAEAETARTTYLEQRSASLEQELVANRRLIADAQLQLETLDSEKGLFEIRAPAAGVIEAVGVVAIGAKTSSATPLFRLHMPRDKVRLAAGYPVSEIDGLVVNQQVSAKLNTLSSGRQYTFSGIVKGYSHRSDREFSQTKLLSLQIEIDIPDQQLQRVMNLEQGVQSEVTFVSKEQPLWRYLYAMVRQLRV